MAADGTGVTKWSDPKPEDPGVRPFHVQPEMAPDTQQGFEWDFQGVSETRLDLK